MCDRPVDLSVVVPLYDEEANVPHLVDAVRRALEPTREWELILVDDGSRDGTAEAARTESQEDPRVHLIRLARNYGQTAAMQAGFDHAKGEAVVSMDGDLQNDPRDIPRLLAELEKGYDLVVGYREDRKDELISRKIPSWAANRMIQRITGVSIRDNGCSLKAFRRSTLKKIYLYSELHRFIPAVAAGSAGARITEIPVRHHPRRFGRSKYGLSRIWRVLVDLVTVTMIRWFRERPLLMFGCGASVAALVGFLFAVAALISIASFSASKATALVFPGGALLCFELAGYLLMLGLMGEVALHWRWRGDQNRLRDQS